MNTQQIGAIAKEYGCELVTTTFPGRERPRSRSRKQNNSKSNKANGSKANNTFLALRLPQSKTVHYLGDLRILQTLNAIELRSAISETLKKAVQR
jgi:hypothetical protein